MAESWRWRIQAFNNLAESRILSSTAGLGCLNTVVPRGWWPGDIPQLASWRSAPQHGCPGGTHPRGTCVEPAWSQNLLETLSWVGHKLVQGLERGEGVRQEPSNAGAEGEGTWGSPAATTEGFSAKVWEWERSGKRSWQLCLGLHGYEATFMPIT